MNVPRAIKPPSDIAARLTVQERVFLFCIASGTDWSRAGVTVAAAAQLLVRNLVHPHPSPARYKLTPLGRKVFAALVAMRMAEQEGDAA
jgi:hypothetical protein